MNSSLRAATRIGFALVLFSVMWFYVQRVLIPYQENDAAKNNRPRGNLSDLYPRWVGARELLLHGRDPYSPEVTREIQTGYYGRPLDPDLPNDPKDQQAFAYPVYVVFLLAPTITLQFSLVKTAFFGLLLFLTAVSVMLWLDFVDWRPGSATVIALTLLTVGSFSVIQGLKLQQLSLLVAGLIALSAMFLSRGYLFSAGVLMAVATIKPQLAIPIACWLLLWASSAWRNRKRYIFGFGFTVSLLFGASEWVLPGWINRFHEAVSAYRVYTGGSGSLLDTLITPAWGRLFTVLLVLIVILLCWKFRNTSENQAQFYWVTSLVLTATVVIVPMIAPYNHVLLLPSILLLVRYWAQMWKSSWITRTMSVAAAAVILWPWIGAGVLTLLSAFAPPEDVQHWWAVPLYSSLFIPVLVLAMQLIFIKLATVDRAKA